MEGESKSRTPMSQSQNAFGFKTLDAEMWLLGRLQQHIAQVFSGATDPDVRRERVRRAIILGELDQTILGKRAGGGAENYAQAFERLYGEPLHIDKRKGKST
jgi:hypothetical protein